MRKIIFLFVFITLGATVFAQTNPVRIESGRFFIGTGYQGGTAQMKSNVFASTGFFSTNTPYNPWDACQSWCRLGQTFTVTNGWAIISDQQHRRGTFTINGTTYEDVYYSGTMSVSRSNFFIPRVSQRKGSLYFKDPFTLSGRLFVCQVNDAGPNCPPDKILFNNEISGHGTLTVKMKLAMDGNQVYVKPESFEYIFE